MADRASAGYTRGRHGAGGAGERDFRRIGAGGRDGVWDDARVCGSIVVALVGAAGEMASAFSGARKNRLDLSVGIALGSATQIALFVAPVLVLLSYVIGPGLRFENPRSRPRGS